jgi:hypothetical protein
MDQNLITAMAGVLGSVSGASAAIATIWIAQKSQTIGVGQMVMLKLRDVRM